MDAPSNNCGKATFDGSVSWSLTKCSWQPEGGGRWGGGDHPLRFWQCRLTWRRREAQEETSGRRVFVQTVRGDEKWEGGKVNMGHSRGRSRVLSSVWKSKWLGPVSACSPPSTLCWAACPPQRGLMPPAGIMETRPRPRRWSSYHT